MACDEARFAATSPARRSQPRRQAVRGGGSDSFFATMALGAEDRFMIGLGRIEIESSVGVGEFAETGADHAMTPRQAPTANLTERWSGAGATQA